MKRDYLKLFYRIFTPFAVLCILAAMYGCEPSHQPLKEYALPPEMKDCKVHLISDGNKELYVVVCPNSVTSTNWTTNCGKNCWKTNSVTVVHK